MRAGGYRTEDGGYTTQSFRQCTEYGDLLKKQEAST